MTNLTIFLLLITVKQSQAFENCVAGEPSENHQVIFTDHAIVYNSPKLCKPLPIDEFSATKRDSGQIYDLNWSKLHHDLWHISSYDVRINGSTVNNYSVDTALPLTIDFTGSPVNLGLVDFEVRACGSLPDDPVTLSCGDWQSTITQCETTCTDPTLQAPTLNVPLGTNLTADYIVNWSTGDYTSYQLEELKQSSGISSVVYNGPNVNHSFINQQNNDTYTYKVRGCNGTVCSRFSSSRSVNVAMQIPSFTATAPINNTGSYTLSWNEVVYDSVIERYKLQKYDQQNNSWGGSSNPPLVNIDQLFYHVTGHSNGVTELYRVKACRADFNCSDFSPVLPITVLFIPSPTTITAPVSGTVNTTGNYQVVWNPSNYATRYEIQQRVNNGSWITDHTNGATSYNYSNQGNGNYSYRVRACNGSISQNVCSAYSPIMNMTVDLPLLPPVIYQLDIITTSGLYNVSWSAVTDANHYILEETDNGTNWLQVYNGSNLNKDINHSNINDAVYQYRVKACNANNSCSPFSGITKTAINRPRFSSETPVTTADISAIESGSAEVGAINGSFQTDQVGQASYSIPIYAGMGTAGLSPKVSLNYSSGSGNGPLGVGWSISGVTVITRCRETQESTTSTTTITPKPITWDTEDRLCLNGEMLYLATGANYWEDNSTYRTERDQFARIKYFATNNNFTIERKDGSISYYGNTADSNIKANVNGATPTYAWVINRYQDNMSNYIDYGYNDLDSGVTAGELEFVLTDIDYTGHLGDDNNQDNNIAPYNSIHFTYENTRTDKTTSYISGASVEMTLRLAEVTSNIDGIEVRSYTLGYDESTASERSLLGSVLECRNNTCLEQTDFDWSQPMLGFASEATSSQEFPKNIKSSKLGDINGDGRADLVYVDEDDSKFKVSLADGTNGFSTYPLQTITSPSGEEINNKWHLIDYNADGRQDLMRNNGSYWVIHLATTNNIGFNTVETSTGIPAGSDDDFQIADINGDGLADLVYPEGDLRVRYLQRDGSNGYKFSSSSIIIKLPANPEGIDGIEEPDNYDYMAYRFYFKDELNVRTQDVNGDGVADLILRTDVYTNTMPDNVTKPYQFVSANQATSARGVPVAINGDASSGNIPIESSHWVAFINNGIDSEGKLDFYSENHYIQSEILSPTADKNIKFIDINADGLTDILTRQSQNSDQWLYRLGTGTGFTTPVSIGFISHSDDMQLIDYNGDSYIDMLYPDTGTNKPYVLRTWEGNGYSNTTTTTSAQAKNLDTNANFFLDLNGDGREDHLRIEPVGETAEQKIKIRKDSFQVIDYIERVTNGLGASTQIMYQPLTFSTVYNQGSNANELFYGNNSPVFDYLSSMYVVSSVITDAPTENNTDNTTFMTYQYAGARVQTGGRGFLGFEKVITSVPVYATSESSNYLLQTETTYHQDFPYIGYPKSVLVTQYEDTFIPPVNTCDTSPENCFPPPCYPGQVCSVEQRGTETSTILSKSTNIVASNGTVGGSVFAYIYSTTEETYSPETGSLLKTRVQTTTHDAYANPLVNTVKIYDGLVHSNNLLHTTTTTNQYTNDTNNWKIGLLESSSVKVERPAPPPTNVISVTTDTAFDYDYTTGLLSEERRFPSDGTDKFLRIRHQYDHFGNETKTISCSKDLSISQCEDTENMNNATIDHPLRIHRYNEILFDNKGRYANSVKNSLEQTISNVTLRDIYGNARVSHDLLSVTTTNNYDVFGQLQSSHSSLGTWTSSSKKWCNDIDMDSNEIDDFAQCPVGAVIRITNRSQGGGLAYEFIDKLGRTITAREQSFNTTDDTNTNGDERWIANEQYYDGLGRSVETVGPYFFGETSAAQIPVTNVEYDRYNRAIKTIMPDGATESISYDGFTMITTNALGQLKTESKNALGELIEAQDHIEGKLNYTYNSQGLVTQIRRTANVNGSNIQELLIDNTYDKMGRKTISKSVDSGTTTSSYNAEGELVSVTDNKNQQIKTYRDALGRVYLTEEFDNFGSKTSSKSFTFNSANNLLLKEQDLMSADGYQRFYFYDNRNRLQLVSVIIDDTENVCNQGGICNFTTYNYYDKHSRSKIEQDASGKAVENQYNDNGFLYQVRNKDNISKEYYKIVETDARSNITEDRKSNNLYSTYQYDVDRGFMTGITSSAVNTDYDYDYDVLGNITKRSGAGKAECFHYDDLNRLTDTYRYTNANQNCSNIFGNIEHKSIFYDGRGNITEKDDQDYNYNSALANSIGNSPHQVQSKGSQSFVYDDNGNNITTTNFDSPTHGLRTRHIEYTVFDKIERVYLGTSGNPDQESYYKYDTSNNRYARVDFDGNGAKKVTYFIGSTEIEFSNNQSAKYKRQLGDFAIVEEHNGISTDRYLFTDHLGSVDKIVNASGVLIQAMSFSAWGERRTPSDWNTFDWQAPAQQATIYQLSQYTSSGFTGHEMVDAFGIINMGGRIYDASLGRMLQADPFVQDPTNTQSFNRYTYVYNNPLSYTDPSGYFSLKKVIGIFVGTIVGLALGPLGFKLVNTYWAAFFGGIVSSRIITGSFRGALAAGITAMASAFITNKIFDFFKNNIAKGTKAASNKHTTPTPEAKSAPLKEGVLGQVKASATAETIESSALSNGVEVVRKIGSVALDNLTVFADSFRELLLSEIRRTFVEMWLSTQILMSTPQFRKVSLGQANVEGHTYDMFMRVRATNLDKAIGTSAAVLTIAVTATQLGRNLIKRGFNSAKGKVDDLIKKFFPIECFRAGTKIHTKDGLKNIEDIKVGDMVLSKDDETGKVEYKTVTQLFKNNDKHIYNLNILNDNGEKEYLGVTLEHPFWVDGKGWVETKDLELSDKLINSDGEHVSIISIELDSELHDTFNFEVEDFHTYFVGDDGVWVHNMCDEQLLKLAKKFKLNAQSSNSKQILENLDDTTEDFLNKFRKGNIKAEFPREFFDKTVREALASKNTTVRKLLIDSRGKFKK